MKKYFGIIILFIIAIPLSLKSQDIKFTESDIVGRWIEVARIEGDSEKEITEFNDTYVFRDNGLFHKGEAAEGIILFNITGRYLVEEDVITIAYKDYISRDASSQKAKKLIFKVLSLSGEKKEMLVSVQDYDYEYQMKLKR